VHNLRRENGTLTSTHTEQAETLNNYFSSVYTDERISITCQISKTDYLKQWILSLLKKRSFKKTGSFEH